MIVGAFFVPHSPVLVHKIGKDHTSVLENTLQSYEKIRQAIELLKPETIVTLSAHSISPEDALTINLNQTYKLDLSEFGDLTTRNTWKPDVHTINHLVYEVGKKFHTNLETHDTVDYGSAIPLHILTEALPSVKIVPITYGELSLEELFRFGNSLEHELSALHKRYILLATGDLSHKLEESSPTGFSPHAKEFDQRVVAHFSENSLEDLKSSDPALLKEVGQCGLRALMVAAGAMKNKNVTTHTLSYETSLGVGYLTGAFELP